MSLETFKKRTSALKIPSEIYKMYSEVVAKCEACRKHKPPAPRQKISGLRALHFGDLVFVDHGEVVILGVTYIFLIMYDAASCLTTAYAQSSTREVDTLKSFRDYMTDRNVCPKAICGDQYFHQPELLRPTDSFSLILASTRTFSGPTHQFF